MFVTGNRNTMLPIVKYFDQLTRRGLNRDFFFLQILQLFSDILFLCSVNVKYYFILKYYNMK